MIADLFPILGDRFRIELVETTGDRATLRQITFDDDGTTIRDVKEQEVELLPARHANARGRAYLEACARRAKSTPHDDVETLMPHDFFAAPLLDAPVHEDAFERVLDDPRARHIMERRPDDKELLATLERPPPPQFTNPELEARIAEGDDSAYSIYGDWLSERGDPRGELIALQLADKDASELLDLYAYEWLGALAWSEPGELEVTWKNGFIETIAFGNPESGYGMRDLQGELHVLAQLPGTRFIRAIEVREKQFWDDAVFQTMAIPPSVRRLEIRTPEYAHLGDIEPAYPVLANIEELRLESRSFTLGAIDLPALRSLELATRGLTRDNLASLRTANFPKLERLVLWLGDEGLHDCNVTLDDLDWILRGENLDGVRHLGLCGRGPIHVLEHMIDAPILARLEVLDAAGGYVSDSDCEWFSANHHRFAHLRALHVPHRAPALSNVVIDERFVPVYE